MSLDGCRVLLGVGGGIAAYKSAGLVRELRRAGAEVRVILTAGAEQFITPLTLQTLSGNRVGTTVFDPAYEHEIGHIELARWAQVVILAPATANLIARMRAGMADDLLTTVLLATRAPVVVCPAMNTAMFEHVATQENLAALASRPGVTVVTPDAGDLACGETGPGRLPDPEVILAATGRAVTPARLAGLRVVVSAGPTREAFDPVRFLSNPSSGKMGFAVAAAAWRAGAEVTLIAGPVSLPTPWGVRRVDVVTAEQMSVAVRSAPCDVLVMAAAVSDWTPVHVSAQKEKKSEGPWRPELSRTVDILRSVSMSSARPRLVVGFAAETENVEAYARRKLEEKQLDGIVANSVAGPGGAFGNDRNTVLLLDRRGTTATAGPASKDAVAEHIVAWISGMPLAGEVP